MAENDSQWYDDLWKGQDGVDTRPDGLLVSHLKSLTPGRVLELGCGAGANAVWLAEQGWTVEAVDFSEEAVKLGRALAAKRGVTVEFVVGDAATFRTGQQFDLIASFYIQLPPQDRARMLATVCLSLKPGGRLLFVSHDTSNPPSQWSGDDLDTLTTADEVVAELTGLDIEVATVVQHEEASHMHHADEPHAPQSSHQPSQQAASETGDAKLSSTVILAVRPR